MKLTSLFGCAIAASLLACAGDATADSAVNGPYYASPSWDQTLPASTRFIVLANFAGQAVLDRETGLVWQRAINGGIFPYQNAFYGCAHATTGGRLGWRLPTISELSSLFDPNSTDPSFLPAGHPFTGFPTGAGPSPAPPGSSGMSYGELWSSTSTVVSNAGTTLAFPSRLTVTALAGPGYHVLQIRPEFENNFDESYWCVRGGNDNGGGPVTTTGGF